MTVVRSSAVDRWIVVSSACWCIGGAEVPSGSRMAEILPSCCSFRHIAAKGCAVITYNKGDSGLPWAQPAKIGKGLPIMVSGSGSLLASATVPIMVVRGRCACPKYLCAFWSCKFQKKKKKKCACLHSACCGRPTSDGLKALKVLGARSATLRVVRGLGVCTTH